MSNKGVKRPKLGKPKQKAKKSPERKGLPKIAVGVASGGLALLGGIAAVVTLFPRVTTNLSDPVDANNPFSSTITIANTGYIPLDSVGFAVTVRNVLAPNGGGLVGDPKYNSLLVPDIGKARNLGLDEKFTVPFNAVIDGDKDDLGSADIGIVVFYKVPIFHWERMKLFPIKLVRQSNGNFYPYADAQPEDYKGELKGYRIAEPLHLPHRQPN